MLPTPLAEVKGAFSSARFTVAEMCKANWIHDFWPTSAGGSTVVFL